jgi:hypothetical protein
VSYQSVILADTPVGYWRLNDTDGVCRDESGNALDGTYAGAVTTGEPGIPGGGTCCHFDGAGGTYANVPHNTALDVGDVFSLEAWIWIPDPPNTNTKVIVSKGDGNWLFKVVGPSDGRLFLTDQWVTEMVATNKKVPEGGWHHVVATKSGTSIHLYVDGVDDTGGIAAAPAMANNTTPLQIGTDTHQHANPWQGWLDEVAVYNYVLTPAQVKNHYDTGLIPFIDVAPTGGLRLDGQAAAGLTFSRAPTGGVELAGTCETIVNTLHDKHPEGGIEVGGQATAAFVSGVAPAGGVELAGQATRTLVTDSQTAGGAQLDGQAASALTAAHAPAGGVQTGGQATTAKTSAAAPAGGVQTGGQATTSRALADTPTGGIVPSGAATTARTLTVAPAGGVHLAGECQTIVDTADSKNPVGGIEFGGQAATARTSATTPAGGVQLGGVCATTQPVGYAPTGGVQTGGAAVVTWTWLITAAPTGGITLTGSCQTTAGFSPTPRAGVQLGGSCQTSVSYLIRYTVDAMLTVTATADAMLTATATGGADLEVTADEGAIILSVL